MAQGKEGKRHTRGASTAVALVLLIAGAFFLFAPLVRGAISQASMNEAIREVQELYSSAAGDASADGGAALVNDSDGSGSVAGGESNSGSAAVDGGYASADSGNNLSQMREWLEGYNQKVANGEIAIASDPFTFTEAIGLFGSQGLNDGLIGYIEIPAMSCSLPLYLGSSEEHMAKGATVVSGSSVPLGEESSNCVIAAHRGYGDAPMFRDIEKLAVGDEVRVCSPWEQLTYTVVGTKIIDPSDSSAVGVQQGRDLVTLVTCHPYGYNTYRYVVECERSGDSASLSDQKADSYREQGSNSQEDAAASVKAGISLPEVEDWLRAIGGVLLLSCAVVLVVRAVRGRRHRFDK